MNSLQSLEQFEKERAKEGAYGCLVIMVASNGAMVPWVAHCVPEEAYAGMLDEIARWATTQAKLYRPAGRA